MPLKKQHKLTFSFRNPAVTEQNPCKEMAIPPPPPPTLLRTESLQGNGDAIPHPTPLLNLTSAALQYWRNQRKRKILTSICICLLYIESIFSSFYNFSKKISECPKNKLPFGQNDFGLAESLQCVIQNEMKTIKVCTVLCP